MSGFRVPPTVHDAEVYSGERCIEKARLESSVYHPIETSIMRLVTRIHPKYHHGSYEIFTKAYESVTVHWRVVIGDGTVAKLYYMEMRLTADLKGVVKEQ